MRIFRVMWLLALLTVVVLPAGAASKKAVEKDVAPVDYPWPLRVHYTFPSKGMLLDYDEKFSRMRVSLGEALVIADDMAFSIEFADGTAWNYRSLEEAKTVRDPYTDPQIGPGTTYTTTYPLKDGLEVRYIVTVFNTRPFISMQLVVENKGTADVRLAGLDPLVTGPAGITNLSPQARVRNRNIESRGGYPVFDKTGSPIMTVFSDPSNKAVLALGILPEGKASSGTKFEQQGGAWHGRILSRFEPPVRLAPGQTLKSDRVCLIHGQVQKGDIDLYYSWALSVLNPPKDNRKGPTAWITVTEDKGLDQLVADARAWASSGIKHALVPANWESKPGSMKGAAPRYPGNMKSAADALDDAGTKPGITFDPLAVEEGPKDAIAQTSDGQLWLNPASASAADFARKRYAKLGDWGYDFVVVAPSTIPDPVLESWGVTRTEAYRLGLDLVENALGERPVYPASAGSVKATRADWLEAASALGRLGSYGAGLAPLRLDAAGLGDVDGETVGAMRLWRGPIEVQGRADGGAAKALSRVFQLPRIDGNAVDLDRTDPLVWQIDFKDDKGKVVGANVLTFSGAEPFPASDLDLADGSKLRLWDPQRNKLAGDPDTVTPAGGLNLYGAGVEASHPAFLGASDSKSLSIANVKFLEWDGGSSTMKGAFDSDVTTDTAVQIHVPASWAVSSVQVGGKKAKAEAAGELLTFGMEGSTTFEVRFQQK